MSKRILMRPIWTLLRPLAMAGVLVGLLVNSANVSLAATGLNYQAELARGVRAYAKRDFDQAIAHFTRCLSLEPAKAEIYLKRGNAYAEVGKRARASEDYDRGIELEPANAEIHFSRAFLIQEMGDPENALMGYTRALSLKADYEAPLNNRAVLLRKKGEFQAALADYNQLVEKQPAASIYRMGRAQLLIEMKRYQAAIDDLSQVIELNPKDDKAYYARAEAWHWLKNDGRAVADYEMAIKLGFRNARVLNDLAWVLVQTSDDRVRNVPRAIKLALRASQLNKDKKDAATIYDTLAVAYERDGQPELAKKYHELSRLVP